MSSTVRCMGELMEEELDLDDMSQEVRRIYISERQLFNERIGRPNDGRPYRPSPQWDGGLNRARKRFKPIWPKIAELINKLRADPEEYIRVQFDAHEKRQAFEPNYLLSERAVASYKRICSRAAVTSVTLQTAYASQMMTYELQVRDLEEMTRWTKTDILKNVLLDETLLLSALFRYGMAQKEGLKDVAKRYYSAAVVQYVRHRDIYDVEWKDLIPKRLQDRADEDYDRIVR